jgi:hypothetical protein
LRGGQCFDKALNEGKIPKISDEFLIAQANVLEVVRDMSKDVKDLNEKLTKQ